MDNHAAETITVNGNSWPHEAESIDALLAAMPQSIRLDRPLCLPAALLPRMSQL